MMKEVRIELSKRKVFFLFLAGIVFSLISITFITNPGRFVTFLLRNEQLIFIIGIVGLLTFGIGSILMIPKIFERKIGLVVNNDGIYDNTTTGSVGLIKWADITDISTKRIAQTSMILIRVKNPDYYIEKEKGLKKFSLKRNVNNYGTPIVLTSVGLDCSFKELERLILESYNQSKQI